MEEEKKLQEVQQLLESIKTADIENMDDVDKALFKERLQELQENVVSIWDKIKKSDQ